MKVIEVRIKLPDEVPDDMIIGWGEEAQLQLPVDFEQEGYKVIDVTYELKKELD